MKTRNIALIFLASAALMLSACANEPEIENGEDITFDKDESMFKIGSVQTRAADEFESTTHEIASVTTDNGDTFVLQETVTSLDDVDTAPETRGTPAFTQNVKQVYGSFYTYAMKEGGSAAFAKTQAAGVGGVKYTLKTNGPEGHPEEDIYHYHYGEDIWGNLPTYFFMRMPGENDGVTLGNNPYSWNDGSITFSYTTPATAPEQKDILFASYKRTAETNAEKVTFYHALTGVKFANFFDYSLKEGAYAKAETIIKNIKISGLKNTGTCKVTPDPAKHSYDQGVVVWSGLDGSGTYSQDIDYDFAKYRTDLFPEGTLNSTASKQNLNKNDGSLTFFFIPQDLTSDVTIEVTFDITLKKKDSNGNLVLDGNPTFENVKFTFKLAEKLNADHRTWKAGELHTFTLWPRAIGVKIADTMNAAKDKKSDVVVKNTGNTWQYVRVNLIGNWVGQVQKSGHADDLSNPTILMGYSNATYATGYDGTTLPPQYANEIETQPWNDKDGYTNYGLFENLTPRSYVVPAPAAGVVNNWVRYDKYYYYTKAIGPNDAITEPLFDSYTVYTSPEFWIPDIQGIRRLAKNVHLEMDLMVEAIEAPTDAQGRLVYPDGTLIGTNTDGYIKAWVVALGLTADNDLLDLK